MSTLLKKTQRLATRPSCFVGKSYHSTSHNQVLRIVLTGGPCSGKSSALEYLKKHLEGTPVYCAPEAATLLNHTGVKFDPQGTYEQHHAFQLAICRMQLALEDNLTEVASSRHSNAVVLCDRGIIDNKGYMSDQLWKDVMDGLTLTEASLLQSYAGVIHMDTAAKGALEFYKSGDTVDDSGNAVSRRESPEEAAALDDQMWAVWQGHPHHHRVPNVDADANAKTDVNPFQTKLAATVKAVEAIMKEYQG